jgi:HEAT repeat protein
MKQALITLAAQRRIEKALPAITASLGDADAGIRGAAIQAAGVLGADKEVADLARLLAKTQDSRERGDIEIALISISGRTGTACVHNLVPLTKAGDSAVRIIGLHALANAGGADALAAISRAVDDQDETVQDEAVRTLATWPNNWPEDATIAGPLLAVAKSDQKMSHQVLALHAYLQFLKDDKQLKESEKVAKVQEVLPLLQRQEEKRAAIGVVGAIPSAGALDILTTFAADSAVADDACSAIVKLAGKTAKGFSKEDRRKALEAVVEKSQSGDTKRKAEDLLKKIS